MSKGWDELHSAMQSLSQELRQIAPDAATAEEGEAYVARVLTTCLNDSFLRHLLQDQGLYRALPTRGAPNPDYIMQHAGLDHARTYQLVGHMNSSERVGVGLFRITEAGSLEVAEYVSIDASIGDANGNFQIDISASANGPLALPLQPEACILLIRTLHRSQSGVPARLQLLGATPSADLALTGGSSEAALVRVTQTTIGSIRQFISWSQQAASYPNQFRGDVEGLEQTLQGDPNTDYFLGYFDLADDEVLQVTMPADLIGYWSIHAYNHWCEYLPGASAHDLNTYANGEGVTVIHIGPRLSSGTVNPVDTKGRKKGVLICRVIDDVLATPPETAVLKL